MNKTAAPVRNARLRLLTDRTHELGTRFSVVRIPYGGRYAELFNLLAASYW